MTDRILWQIVACVTALTLFPTSSGAQSPATTFSELRQVLRPGEQVIVTHADGRRTREIVVALSDTSLELRSKSMFRFRSPGPRTTHSESSIVKVKRVDSAANGILIGLGIGAGLGIAGCMAQREQNSCALVAYMPVVFGSLMGGLSGGLVDAALRKTIYRDGTQGSAAIVFSPLINTKTTGASLSLRF
jgi:hypothetical protein